MPDEPDDDKEFDKKFQWDLDRAVLEYVIVAQSATRLSTLHQLIGQFGDRFRETGTQGLGLGDVIGSPVRSQRSGSNVFYLIEMIVQMTVEAVLHDFATKGQIGREKGEWQQFQHLLTLPRTCWQEELTWAQSEVTAAGAFWVAERIDQKWKQLKDAIPTGDSPATPTEQHWDKLRERLKTALQQVGRCLAQRTEFVSFVLGSQVHQQLSLRLRDHLPDLLPIIRPYDANPNEAGQEPSSSATDSSTSGSNKVWEFAYSRYGQWRQPRSEDGVSAVALDEAAEALDAFEAARRRIRAVQRVLIYAGQPADDDFPLWKDGAVTFTRLARAWVLDLAPAWSSVQKGLQHLESDGISDQERRDLEARVADFGDQLKTCEPAIVSSLTLASRLGRLADASNPALRLKIGLEAIDKWVPGDSSTWEEVAYKFSVHLEQLPPFLQSEELVRSIRALSQHDRPTEFDYSILEGWMRQDVEPPGAVITDEEVRRSALKVRNHLFAKRAASGETNPVSSKEIVPYLVCESAGDRLTRCLHPSHSEVTIGEWSEILLFAMSVDGLESYVSRTTDAESYAARFSRLLGRGRTETSLDSTELPLWLAAIALRRLGFEDAFLADFLGNSAALRLLQQQDQEWNKVAAEQALELTNDPGFTLYQEVLRTSSHTSSLSDAAQSSMPPSSPLTFSLILLSGDQFSSKSKLATFHPLASQPCVCLPWSHVASFVQRLTPFGIAWRLRDVFWENPASDQSPADLLSLLAPIMSRDTRIVAVYRELPSQTKFPWNRLLPKRLADLLNH